jgi:hypothetical protein
MDPAETAGKSKPYTCQHIAQQLTLKRVFFYLLNSLVVESASVPFGAGTVQPDPSLWCWRRYSKNSSLKNMKNLRRLSKPECG